MLRITVLACSVLIAISACENRSTTNAGSELISRCEALADGFRYKPDCDKLRFVGHGRYAQLGLLPRGVNPAAGYAADAEGLAEALGERKVWQYRDWWVVPADDVDDDHYQALAVAAAYEALGALSPSLIAVMNESQQFPDVARESAAAPWRNRIANFVVSFDRTPRYIAAQTTLIENPCETFAGAGDPSSDRQYCNNTVVLSIDSENVRGRKPGIGSSLIYGLPLAADNYRRYLHDGLIYSIAHEFIHSYIDQQNGVSPLSAEIRNARASEPGVNAEEALVTATALKHLAPAVESGVVSNQVVADATSRSAQILADAAVLELLNRWCQLASDDEGPLQYHCPE